MFFDVAALSSSPALLLGAIFAATVAATLLMTAPARTPAQRLARYTVGTGSSSPGASVETLGASERLLFPTARRVADIVGGLAPPRVHHEIARKLRMAGMGTSPSTFLAVRTSVMAGLPLLGLWYLWRTPEPTFVHWAMLGASLLLGLKLPTMYLKRRIRARQRAIDRALPYALDTMVACLEGGLSLDAALVKVSEESDGPLAAEIRGALQEMSLGRGGGEALRLMGERAGAEELKRFTGSVSQAERLGIAIGEAMRSLAADSRTRRRQRAEEQARKAPIKMVPVLIFCILPALFIVVLGPSALSLMRIMSQPVR